MKPESKEVGPPSCCNRPMSCKNEEEAVGWVVVAADGPGMGLWAEGFEGLWEGEGGGGESGGG